MSPCPRLSCRCLGLLDAFLEIGDDRLVLAERLFLLGADRQRLLDPARDVVVDERLRAVQDAGQGVVVAPSGSGRTCDRGSGRSRSSGRGRPGPSCRSARRPRPSPARPCSAARSWWGRARESAVAISCRRRCSGVAAGSRSPAICSMMKRSYGMSRVEGVDDVIAIAPGVRGRAANGRRRSTRR